jgi:hypothetical protein
MTPKRKRRVRNLRILNRTRWTGTRGNKITCVAKRLDVRPAAKSRHYIYFVIANTRGARIEGLVPPNCKDRTCTVCNARKKSAHLTETIPFLSERWRNSTPPIMCLIRWTRLKCTVGRRQRCKERERSRQVLCRETQCQISDKESTTPDKSELPIQHNTQVADVPCKIAWD